MSTGIGVTLTADDQQLLAILRSVEGKLDQLAASASGSFGQTGAAAARAAAQVKSLETQTGMSAKAMNAAMRGVPAQFTDIITSLQGGQAPLTVLLQQGGQLKDMFGGIGPAARALGGYVLGLVNPWTLAAAAIALTVYALNAGHEEFAATQRQLILTGGAAGVTAGQMQALGAEIDGLSGATQGKAAEVLNMIAAAGVSGTKALRDMTLTAIELERAGGPAVEETVKALASLGKDPVQASAELNKSVNFLSVSIFNQIKALQEQGRMVEAAALAQRAYADEMDKRIPALTAQLGYVERGWRAVGDGAKWAWDQIVGIGRPETAESNLAKALKALETAKKGIYSRDQIPERQEAVTAASRRVLVEQEVAAAKEEQNLQTQAGIKWIDEENSYLSRNQKLGLDILRIQNESVKAIESKATTQEEVNQRIALTIQRADPGISLQQIKDTEAQRLEVLRQSQQQIDTQRALGNLNEIQGIQATTDVTLKSFDIRRSALQAEIADLQGKQDIEGKSAALTGQLTLLEKQRITARIAGEDAITVAIYKQATAAEELQRTFDEQVKSEIEQLQVQENLKQLDLAKATEDYARSLDNANDELNLEAKLMGTTAKQRSVAIEQLKIMQALKERERQIDKLSAFTDDRTKDQMKANEREQAAREIAQVERRAYLDEWQRTWDELSNGLTDALMKAFRSGHDFFSVLWQEIKSQFANTTLKLVVVPIQQGITNLVAGAIGAQQPGYAGGQLYGSAAGMGSLYSMGSALYGGAASLYGSAANYVGTAYANYAGTGLDGLLATNGAYGTAAGSGAAGGAGGASAASSGAAAYAGWAALVYGLSTAAASDFRKGFNAQSAKDTGTLAGKASGQISDALTHLGISDEAASIISGSTGIAKLFGMGKQDLRWEGISGTIQAGNVADAAGYQGFHQDGGMFRSDKDWQTVTSVGTEMSDALKTQASGIYEAVKKYGDVLGLPADALKSIVTTFNVQTIKESASVSAEDVKKALGDAFMQYQTALFDSYTPILKDFQRAGETIEQTVMRLATLRQFSGDLNELGGIFARVAGLSVDARESFIAMAGGMDALRTQAQSFVENYYTRDEVAGVKAREIQDALKAVGITQDISTKDQFRALVEGVDVSSTQGQQQLATLLQAQGSFADVADYLAQQGGGSLASAAQGAPQMGALGGILSAPEQAQIDAINSVTGAVNEVRDAIIDLGQSISGSGGATTYPSDTWEVAVDTGP